MADSEYYGIMPTNSKDVENRYSYTATSLQTTFAATYAVGYVDVFYNGSHLDPTTEFTATDGTSVILTNPATLGANVYIITRRQVLLSSDVPVKAWVCFTHNGTTTTIKASGGVSGVAATTTSFTITLAAAQADTNYGVLNSCSNNAFSAYTFTRNAGSLVISSASTLTGTEFMVQILR